MGEPNLKVYVNPDGSGCIDFGSQTIDFGRLPKSMLEEKRKEAVKNRALFAGGRAPGRQLSGLPRLQNRLRVLRVAGDPPREVIRKRLLQGSLVVALAGALVLHAAKTNRSGDPS